MISALVFQIAVATATPILPRDACTCAVAVESEDARIERLDRELRLARATKMVNAGMRRHKRGTP